jgi:hypothetical protein
MKNKLLGLTATGYLLIAFVFLAVAPAQADDVDQKIKALEQKLSQLKEEQMELKKEAVAAEAKLPNFFYRPSAGATVEAADRAWSVNFAYEGNFFIYNALNGSPHRGNTVGDLFIRRSRPRMTFCLNNCFYEWGFIFNADTQLQVTEQNQWFDIHFEQINPWFPSLTIGDKTYPVGLPYVLRSSVASAQTELASDMLLDNQIDPTSDASRKAIGIYWADRPIPGAMLPGDFTLDLEFKSGGGIKGNVITDTDRKQFQGTFGVKPFVRSKNPWLEKLKAGGGIQIGSIDGRSVVQGRRLRLMTMERGSNRVTLLDANGIGGGLQRRVEAGVEWGYGPYLARVEGGWSKFSSGETALPLGPLGSRSDGFLGVSGRYWRIGHEIFLWSPKGFLTGSAAIPHSLQLGWAFERAEAECGTSLAAPLGCAGTGGGNVTGDFHRNYLINRDLSLWYFITRAIRVGAWWWWWDSAKTPRATQVQIGCRTNVNVLGTPNNKSCTWHTVNFGLQAAF